MKYYIVSKVEELKGITLNDARVMTPEEVAATDWMQYGDEPDSGTLELLTVESLEKVVREAIKNGTLLVCKALLSAAFELQGKLSLELFTSTDIVKATTAADDLTKLHTSVLVLKSTMEEFTNNNFGWYKSEWEDFTIEEILADYRGF